MTTREDVQKFLNDFFAKYKVYDILFRDYRNKNSTTLLSLEITPNKRREIIESIQLEDYSQGPLDDKLYGIASMWIFGKLVKRTEVYIKISLGNFNSKLICISFHDAEYTMKYPFKTV